MKNMYILTLVAVALLFNFHSGLMAQTETKKATFKLLQFEEENFGVAGVSPGGKYLFGRIPSAGFAFSYNVEKDLFEIINETDMAGTTVSMIDDNGFAFGAFGEGQHMGKPSVWKDGVFTLLPVPEARDSVGSVYNIAKDGKTLIGYKSNRPCLWQLKGDKYEYVALNCPELDYFGHKPQWVAAYHSSLDDKILFGVSCENTGFFMFPCIWKQKEDGTYGEMTYLGLSTIFNLNEENPGPQPYYSDFVTVKKGDPEYDEQFAHWEELEQKWRELLAKFSTGYYPVVTSGTVSPDGKYIVAGLKHVENRSEKTYPCLFSTEDGSCTFLKTTTAGGNQTSNLVARFMMKDGTIFAHDGMETWVYENKDASPEKVFDWFLRKYELDLRDEFSKTSAPGVDAAGWPAISADENMFVFHIGSGPFINYYVKINDGVGIDNITNEVVNLQVKDNTLFLNGDANKVNITDMSGKTVYQNNATGSQVDVSRLAQGLYIVKVGYLDGNMKTYKITLAN